jgi:hypothetical protein
MLARKSPMNPQKSWLSIAALKKLYTLLIQRHEFVYALACSLGDSKLQT